VNDIFLKLAEKKTHNCNVPAKPRIRVSPILPASSQARPLIAMPYAAAKKITPAKNARA